MSTIPFRQTLPCKGTHPSQRAAIILDRYEPPSNIRPVRDGGIGGYRKRSVRSLPCLWGRALALVIPKTTLIRNVDQNLGVKGAHVMICDPRRYDRKKRIPAIRMDGGRALTQEGVFCLAVS